MSEIKLCSFLICAWLTENVLAINIFSHWFKSFNSGETEPGFNLYVILRVFLAKVLSLLCFMLSWWQSTEIMAALLWKPEDVLATSPFCWHTLKNQPILLFARRPLRESCSNWKSWKSSNKAYFLLSLSQAAALNCANMCLAKTTNSNLFSNYFVLKSTCTHYTCTKRNENKIAELIIGTSDITDSLTPWQCGWTVAFHDIVKTKLCFCVIR